MNRDTFKEVADLALSKEELPSYMDSECDTLAGCALPGFQPVTVTKKVAAAFLRGHIVYLNGEVDNTELNEMANIFRAKVHVV